MKRAEEDCTGLSLGVSLPGTSTLLVQRKVSLVIFSTHRSKCEFVFRMDTLDVRFLAIGSRQDSGSET